MVYIGSMCGVANALEATVGSRANQIFKRAKKAYRFDSLSKVRPVLSQALIHVSYSEMFLIPLQIANDSLV